MSSSNVSNATTRTTTRRAPARRRASSERPRGADEALRHEPTLGRDVDRERRRRVYAKLAGELATHFANGESPVTEDDASLVQRIHAQASILYDLRDAYGPEDDARRAVALETANAILEKAFGPGHSLTMAELDSLGVLMREAQFKVLAPYVPIGEVYPCAW